MFSDKQDTNVLVHAEHREKTRHYYARLYRNARTFLLTIFLGVVVLIVFAVLGWVLGEAAVVVYYGVVFYIFPFSSGATFEIAGIKNSVRFVQISGAAFIVGGSVLLYVAL